MEDIDIIISVINLFHPLALRWIMDVMNRFPKISIIKELWLELLNICFLLEIHNIWPILTLFTIIALRMILEVVFTLLTTL
jgi:hypothetical protein